MNEKPKLGYIDEVTNLPEGEWHRQLVNPKVPEMLDTLGQQKYGVTQPAEPKPYVMNRRERRAAERRTPRMRIRR